MGHRINDPDAKLSYLIVPRLNVLIVLIHAVISLSKNSPGLLGREEKLLSTHQWLQD